MSVQNIIEGRNRAIEILNRINPKEAQILYGPRYNGINYCPFIYKKNGNWTGVTVRTTNRSTSIKFSEKLLEYNISECQECQYDHELILGLDWSRRGPVFIIPLNFIDEPLLDSIIERRIKNEYIVVVRERLEEGVKSGLFELL